MEEEIWPHTWKLAGDRALANYFALENIWQKEWSAVEGETVIVKRTIGSDVVLQVWQVEIHGRQKKFAAGEASMSLWVFALPA